MLTSMCGTVLLGLIFLTTGMNAWAQGSAGGQPESFFEIAITGDAARAVLISGNSFWLEGGSVQMHGRFWHGLGVVADVAGLHTGNIHDSGTGLDLVTATFGPRYTWPARDHRYSLFGEALAGEANGINSVFPGISQSAGSANGLAVQLGGGMNINYKRHLGFRAFEADWLRTQLPNTTTHVQNNVRLGAGIILRFDSHH
jgi:hypothetical protein